MGILSKVYSQTPDSIHVLVQKGHNDWVTSIALSDDGKLLLTGSSDQTIILWDALTGRQMNTFFGHRDGVQSIKFLHNNKFFISGSVNGDILLWSIYDNKPIDGVITNGPVTDLDVYSDDKEFAFASLHGGLGHFQFSSFHDNPLQIVTDSLSHTFVSLIGNSSMLYIANDSVIVKKENETEFKFPITKLDQITSEQAKQEISMRRMEASMIPMIIKAGGLQIPNDIYRRPYLVSRKRMLLFEIVPTTRNLIKAWNLKKGNLELNIPTTFEEIDKIAVSSDDNILAAVNKDGAIFLYDLANRKQLGYIPPTSDNTFVEGLTFSKDSRSLFITDKERVQQIDIANKKEELSFAGFADTISAIALNSSSNHFLIQDDRKLMQLDIRNNAPTDLFSPDAKEGEDAIKPDGSFGKDHDNFSELFNQVKIKNLVFGEKFAQLKFDSTIMTADKSIGFVKSIVEEKDLSTGKTRNFNVGENIKRIFYFPRGNSIVAYSEDQTMYIFDATNLTLKCKIPDVRQLSSLDFSADGNILIYSSTDRQINLYYLPTNRAFKSFSMPFGENIRRGWGHTVEVPNLLSCSPKSDYCALTTWSGDIIIVYLYKFKAVFANRDHKDLINYMHFSDDGKFLLTYSIDNTLRLWDCVTPGDTTFQIKLRATYYFIKNQLVTLLPNNYYYGSKQAAKRLSFVRNGISYAFDQLDIKYNRPDKVLSAMGSIDTGLISSYHEAYKKRIEKLGIDTNQFKSSYSIPEADIENRDSLTVSQANRQITLHIVGRDSTYTLDRFNVWINDVPIFGLRGISLKKIKSKLIDTSIIINLVNGKNRIETAVINSNGSESYHIPLTINYDAPGTVPEKLYFIGIGTDRFANSEYNLKWSVKDIHDLALKFKAKYGVNCVIDTLFNDEVTVEGISALKKKLLQTDIDDKVIVAFSGHGLFSKAYDYYLSSYAVDFNDPTKNGIPYDVLEDLLDSIPARKKLMLLDACNSGNIDRQAAVGSSSQQSNLDPDKLLAMDKKDLDEKQKKGGVGNQYSFELMQQLFTDVGRNTGSTIISASAGTQFAHAEGDLNNGVFTYCILDFLRKDHCTISALKEYVNKRVPQLTNGLQVPTTRTETNEFDWDLW